LSEQQSFIKRLRTGGKEESEMSFVDHLEALRWHIVRAVLAIVICAIVFFIYIDQIFENCIFQSNVFDLSNDNEAGDLAVN
jgi:Sec-independent protein secretion pathway component TatC